MGPRKGDPQVPGSVPLGENGVTSKFCGDPASLLPDSLHGHRSKPVELLDPKAFVFVRSGSPMILLQSGEAQAEVNQKTELHFCLGPLCRDSVMSLRTSLIQSDWKSHQIMLSVKNSSIVALIINTKSNSATYKGASKFGK